MTFTKPDWAIAKQSTRPSRRLCPNIPVIDIPNCTYFQKGTCKACEKFCPTNAIDFNQEDEIITVQVGNIILATGYDLFDPRQVTQYGYGRLANVFTSLEFERLTNAAGPTNGNIVLRDGVTTPTVGGHHPLRGQPRPQLQQLLFGDLLHAEPEVRPPGPRAHRRHGLQLLHRHAHRL